MNDDINNSKNNKPRCSAFCTAEGYDVIKMAHHLLSSGGGQVAHFKVSNAVHRVFGDSGEIFYFAYGAVVMWGLTKEQEEEILSELHQFERNPLQRCESEMSRYSFGDTAKILKDDIVLPANNVLTKFAFSHGLAQSVKLAAFENLIERRIAHSKYVPLSMAQKGRIPMSRKKLAKMMGEIILDRNSINLHTDILDTPEFFWEHSDLEQLYRLIAQDLDIKARVDVLNRRLDILKDLFEMLGNELENRHSSSLEWIIIVLISMEVIVTFAKDIFHIL